MRWFVTRVVVVCIAMTALIGGVVAYHRAHAEPNPLHAYGLDVCNGRPCFMGITPGVTSWEDVQSMIGNPDQTSTAVIPVNEIRFMVAPNSLKVYSIYASPLFGGKFPGLGNFLTQFGIPCRVLVAQTMDGLELDYPRMYISVVGNDQHPLTPYSSVSEIEMVDLSLAVNAPTDLCKDRSTELQPASWIGFASFAHYRTSGESTEQSVPLN